MNLIEDDAQVIDRDFTLLINTLLGTIVTISENEKNNITSNFKSNIDEDFLDQIPDSIQYIETETININILEHNDSGNITIDLPIKQKTDLIHSKSKIWIINKIRNSIAHQNINPINVNGKWQGIEMYNQGRNGIDFVITFSQLELKTFCEYLINKIQ